MDELKRAKITRRAQRAQATKTWNKAEALMAGEINEISIQRLQVVLETFNAKLEQLKRIDESISSKIENEKELEAEIVEADDYLNELMDKRYRIQFFITSCQPSTPINYNNMSAPSASQNQGEHSALQSVSQQSNSLNTHRLPKLSLPTFNGDSLKWQRFWDSYKSAVHDNPSLGDIQKFNYLKAHLSEEAARSIEGLPLTAIQTTNSPLRFLRKDLVNRTKLKMPTCKHSYTFLAHQNLPVVSVGFTTVWRPISGDLRPWEKRKTLMAIFLCQSS
jgi:hypothetical protein